MKKAGGEGPVGAWPDLGLGQRDRGNIHESGEEGLGLGRVDEGE